MKIALLGHRHTDREREPLRQGAERYISPRDACTLWRTTSQSQSQARKHERANLPFLADELPFFATALSCCCGYLKFR